MSVLDQQRMEAFVASDDGVAVVEIADDGGDAGVDSLCD